MRLALLALAAFGLVSCDPAPVNESAETVPLQPGSSSGDPAPPSAGAPPAALPAEGPAAPARTAKAIPAAFHGTYDQSAETCARPSEYRLNVSAGELRFHESIGAVRSVAIEGPDTVSVDADFQGEGESWRAVQRLARDGDRLTISGDGTNAVRIRCPGSVPS
jgi:hypothetical protein